MSDTGSELGTGAENRESLVLLVGLTAAAGALLAPMDLGVWPAYHSFAVVGTLHLIGFGVIYRLLSTRGVVCKVLGHKWDIEPPWSGKEIHYNPSCERCGHEPESIAITGSHEGDHRV